LEEEMEKKIKMKKIHTRRKYLSLALKREELWSRPFHAFNTKADHGKVPKRTTGT
jgi:hypothetical protein